MADLSEIITNVARKFGVTSIRVYQKHAIESLIKGCDCFVSQSTGSGKSLIFQSLPQVHHQLTGTCGNVLIVSPLISLMDDQTQKINHAGYSTISLSRKNHIAVEDLEDKFSLLSIISDFTLICDPSLQDSNSKSCKLIRRGEYQYIVSSPEAILTVYRDLFKNDGFSKKLLAIFVDESHCIKKWGNSSNDMQCFRDCYNRIAELRSLTSQKVPICTLTATATEETKNFIITNLCLESPICIQSSPEKPNIRYSVIKIFNEHFEEVFARYLSSLQASPADAEKVIIFCRKMKDVRRLYCYFNESLKSIYTSYKSRPYAMYHSRTENYIKEHILEEFTKENGTVKVLIATIAFGMGVNCKNLSNVIHVGPSADLDDYFQESGRVGREGQPSNAILLLYPKCLNSKYVTADMTNYCKNTEQCRRKLLLKPFGVKPSFTGSLFDCCDICATSCDTPLETNMGGFLNFDALRVDLKKRNDVINKELFNVLSDVRNECLRDFQPTYCGYNIISGFPYESIQEIINIASENISETSLSKYTSVFNKSFYPKIIAAVQKHLNESSDEVALADIGDILENRFENCFVYDDSDGDDSDSEEGSRYRAHEYDSEIDEEYY